MKTYIENLTNYLISKNRYDDIYPRLEASAFIRHVKMDLDSSDVRDMSPTRLGLIMCSLEDGDVLASKEDVFNGTHFTGDCDAFLREIVSLFLAYVIRERLNKYRASNIPEWKRATPVFDAYLADQLARSKQRA